MKVDLERIEKMFDSAVEEAPATPPKWASELLTEMRELKQLFLQNLQQQQQQSTSNSSYRKDGFYEFVQALRNQLKPNVSENRYPEIAHDGRVFGITINGLLYDKATGHTLERSDAFTTYKSLYYRHREHPLF